MLIRVRSRLGTWRVDIPSTATYIQLKDAIAIQMQIPVSSFVLSRDQGGTTLLEAPDDTLVVEHLGLQHGDMIYAGLAPNAAPVPPAPVAAPGGWVTTTTAATSTTTTIATNSSGGSGGAQPVVEDAIDEELDKVPGVIYPNGKQTATTTGGSQAGLGNLPIEPYDENYLRMQKISHMSFHAKLKQLMDKNKSSGLKTSSKVLLVDDVEELVRKTKRSGSGGLKLGDIPSAVTLRRQEFRIVDHVEFDDPNIVNTFLNFWRHTGLQRLGYLYGVYQRHESVPLGIKAVVSAIYEPPQACYADGVQLELPDVNEPIVDGVAGLLGLRRVGMIYTDLVDTGTGQKKVVCRRHADSFFMSSAEVEFAARHQNRHPSPCKYSSSGKYGSKFVTVIASGDKRGDVSLSAYQVSNQAMALVAADCVVPTEEANLMRVKESTATAIVPEILFAYQDEYRSNIINKANPTLPVDFLLVNVNFGFPKQPKPFFLTPTTFMVENRDAVTHDQLVSHLQNVEPTKVLSDFHLLLYLAASDMSSLFRIDLVCEVLHATATLPPGDEVNSQLGTLDILRQEILRSVQQLHSSIPT